MAFSYVFTLFMFFGGLFGAGNDLLDYIPAEAYWKLKATPMTYSSMADEVRLADPAAAVNLAKAFENSTGADRDRLALVLIDQGEAARAELDRLSRSADTDLAARARTCIVAMDKAPKERSVRRLMAIRTLGALGKKDAIPLLQPLMKSREPFMAAYAAEAIATLEGKPALLRPLPPALKDDIWRLPADCRAVAQVAPKVFSPEVADSVLTVMTLPQELDRNDAIAGLTFTLVQIADRFGNVRFDGITLAASGDLAENAGYFIAILRGHYDHATVNRILSDDRTPFNEFPGGRIYVPGGMAIFAPADDLLIFAAGPRGTPPVQAVITATQSVPATQSAKTKTAAEHGSQLPSTNPAPTETDANSQLAASADMVKLIASVDTTQPVWLAVKSGDAWRNLRGLAPLETLTLTGRPARDTPLELHLEARLSNEGAARDVPTAVMALLPRPPGANPQAGAAEQPASSLPMLDALNVALAVKTMEVDGDRVHAVATFTMTRAGILRLLLTTMDRPRERKVEH
jgi:hypothetical protein